MVLSRLKAEPLSLMVSAFEEEVQDARTPDTSRQYNLQLDSRLTISTKRRHTSTEPTDEIGLRAKYAIMTNLWLLAQMKQPGRSIYKDFDVSTFIDFLDRLCDRDNFHFYKEVDGRPLIAPKWSFCLSYELEIRKEAIKRCKEQAVGIIAALWGLLGDTEHRTKHWLQLVAIPNAPESFNKQEVTDLKKRLAALENRRARSRSPRRQPQKAITGPSLLALPAPASASTQAPPTSKGRSKGNNKGGKGKGKKSSKGKGSGGSGPKKFVDILKSSAEDKVWLHPKFHDKLLCFDFQKKNCRRGTGDCKWEHACAGCGGSKPYDDCLCLADRLKHN